MLFKVKHVNGEWWEYDPCDSTIHESEAFVFDSENPEHMENVLQDFDKRWCVLKLVIKEK